MLMALYYVNTGTGLGTLPRIKRDVNPDSAKPPTGTFEYLLFNLRGMEEVFNGISTMAAKRYPNVIVAAPDQYVTNDFTRESAEKNRGRKGFQIDVVLLGNSMPANSTNGLNTNSKGKKGISSRDNYRAYHQLYKLYQQAFELYNRISSSAKSHTNQVYNSTAEAFKKLRQGVYRKDIEAGGQEDYRPNLRAKFRSNAERVLEYLRNLKNRGFDYLNKIIRQHLPAQDLSVKGFKGLEALLQEA